MKTRVIKDLNEAMVIKNKLENKAVLYGIIFDVGISTGMRVSDILRLTGSNLKYNKKKEEYKISFIESKGTKARITRAKNLVLNKYRDIGVSILESNIKDKEQAIELKLTANKDIYNLLPSSLKAMCDKDIAIAIKKAPKKERDVGIRKDLFDSLYNLAYRNKKYTNIFCLHNLKPASKSNKPITRLSVYNAIKAVTDIEDNIGTHSMRKTFARALYESNDKDVGLVMRVIGHATPAMSLHYIGIDEEDIAVATNNLNMFMNQFK
ncbi:MAG: tyrosine-type recombinase/integrase [Psittacicella sp.]